MRRGGIVLCGGRSTRMGVDKATLPFGGETLLERVVRRLAEVVDEIVVVSRPGQSLPPLPGEVRVAHDPVLDQGPLGGLLPGLAAATADALYVSGCDVPFLAPAFVRLLFDRLGEHDVAVAETGGFVHPLAAVYRRRVAPTVREVFGEGRRRPIDLYERVPTIRVREEEIRRVDPTLATLENLNTREAYEAALARLETGDVP